MGCHPRTHLEEDVSVAHDGDHGARARVEGRRPDLRGAVPAYVFIELANRCERRGGLLSQPFLRP